MPITFPARLDLALTPTPLQPLDRLSAELGGPRIWVKRDDLTGAALSGNKIRKLEFVVAEALAQGCDALITCGGVQSNHCRATALIAAQLGLQCCLLLREDSEALADGNLLLDQLAGAELLTFPKADFHKNLDALFEQARSRYLQEGRKPYLIPTGASDEVGLWGYVAAARELKSDFQRAKIQPQHLVVATGSGGTQAGLTAGAEIFNLGLHVLGMAVCDSEAWFQRKVRSDLDRWKNRYQLGYDLDQWPVLVDADFIGPGYGLAGEEVYRTIQHVARREGLILDPVYTGKAFHGLMELIKSGHFAGENDVVFVHTGGIFGLFPHRDHFNRFAQKFQ